MHETRRRFLGGTAAAGLLAASLLAMAEDPEWSGLIRQEESAPGQPEGS